MLLLWWVFRGEDLGAIARRLSAADPAWLVVTGGISTGGGLIGALRWRLLLEPLGASTLNARWAALNIGFMVTNLFPARLGEIVRPFALSRMAPVSMASALGTVVIERLLDVVALLILFVATVLSPAFPDSASITGRSIGYAVSGAAVVVAVALAFVAVMILWPTRVIRLAEAIGKQLPSSLREGFTGKTEAFLSGFEVVRRPAVLLKALLWSLLLWAWWATAIWAAFRAFGIELGFTAAMFTQCAVSIFIALPAGPGFIGAMEAGVSVSLHEVFAIPTEATLSLAVGYHLAGFVPVTLLGLYYASTLGLRLGSIGSEAERAL